jgi:hypothetical protein
MRRHGNAIVVCVAAGLALLAVPQSARAQDILQSIFGGFQRAYQPPSAPTDIRAYSDPAPILPQAPNRSPDRIVSHGGGLPTAYCVRTCDGHYFPLQPHPGLSIAQACRSFCPASETRIYRGGTIDTAVASDGRRYADLPNAYAYRRHLVAGCTCNGRDAFGLAPIAPFSDPTLKPGDVVATSKGLVAFSGGKRADAGFTPVQDYTHFSKGYRNQLSTMRIAPSTPGAPGEFTPSASLASDKLTAQLER